MKKITSAASAVLVASVLALASGCSDDAGDEGASGKGTVAFTTWAEEYIEQEIPAADVEDGWTIKYEKFFIVIADVSVAEDGKAPAAKMPTPKLFGMVKAGEKPVASFADVPGKAYPHVSYAVVPVTAATEIADGATDADKQAMIQGGYSVYVEGSGTKDGVTKKFAWGFQTNTLYDKCKGELAGKETDGVVVTNGGTDNVQLTIHGDHLFYDDLQSPEAKVRFQHIADADADNDGSVTLDELARVQLAAIPKEKGTFGTGSAANVNDLRAFVADLSRTVGHYRGEGECLARAR